MSVGKRLDKTSSRPNQSGVSKVSVVAVEETKKTRKPSGPRVYRPVQIVVRITDGNAVVVLATKDELKAARVVMDAMRTGDTSIQLLTVRLED